MFDKAPILESLSGEEDLFREVVEVFLGEIELHIGRVETALAQGAAEALTLAAHTAKGSVANFHAEPATSLARQVEQLARAGRLTEAAPAAAAMAAAFRELGRDLQAALK